MRKQLEFMDPSHTQEEVESLLHINRHNVRL